MDVICVQEPASYPGTKTQNHPGYDCYAPVTHECETCAMSKAHQIISRRPARRVEKPFERVHFDLIEFEEEFDGSRYVLHFTDDLTRIY